MQCRTLGWTVLVLSQFYILVAIAVSAAEPPPYWDKLPAHVKQQRLAHQAVPPEVIRERFQRLSDTQGLWRGYIRGEGPIELLLIVRNKGRNVTTRYIGSVIRDRHERPTSFAYRGHIPKNGKWSWRILARRPL